MKKPSKKEKVKEAEKFGIDVSLLIENLKLTPTQRIEKNLNLLRIREELKTAGERVAGRKKVV